MKKKTTINNISKQLDNHADKVIKRRNKKDTRPKKDSTRIKGDYHLDLRQDVAWDNYVDPRSATFNNAKASAIKAGYAPTTANIITTEEWWVKRVMHLMEMLPRAEDVLFEDLNMDTMTTITIGGDKKGKKSKKKGDDDDDFDEEESSATGVQTISIINPKLRKIRQDSAMFIAETLGRKKYHKKVEVDNNNNISLVEGNEALDNLFRKGKK